MNTKTALLGILLSSVTALSANARNGEFLCGQRGEVTVELQSGWNKIQIVSEAGVGNYTRLDGMTYQLQQVISDNPADVFTLSNCHANPGDE